MQKSTKQHISLFLIFIGCLIVCCLTVQYTMGRDLWSSVVVTVSMVSAVCAFATLYAHFLIMDD